jgi:hypothetical protein
VNNRIDINENDDMHLTLLSVSLLFFIVKILLCLRPITLNPALFISDSLTQGGYTVGSHDNILAYYFMVIKYLRKYI